MSSSENSDSDHLHTAIIYLHQYVLPVFYLLGNLGNFLSALIFARRAWRKNVCVFYFNMCLFFNTCYINSVLLADILTGFDIKPYDSNRVLCKLYYYTVSVCFLFLPTVLILASIDRLLISSQNIDARLYSSKRLAYFSISIGIFFWFLFLLHIPVNVDLQAKHPTEIVCYFDLSSWYYRFVSYSSLIINCFLSLTMIILCIFAFQNVRRIRAIPRQRREQIRTMTKKDFQLLRCLFVHDIIYILFTVGFSIFTVYDAATSQQMRSPLKQAILDFLNHFHEFLHHIPYCANFYIYIMVSKAFRNALKRMIYRRIGKDITTIHEEEHAGKDNIVLNAIVVHPIV